MARSMSRSSRELSAAALESERNHEEQKARAQSIEAQIAALKAQHEEAAKEAERYREEKEANEQAAKEQSFHEFSLEKQSNFRDALAGEVYARIAQVLQWEKDWEYIQAIAEGRPHFEEPTKLKAMLWEAIAGDSNDFLRQAAARVYDRKEEKISNIDLDEIRSSNTCLLATQEITKLANVKSVSEIEDPEINGAIMTEPQTEIPNLAAGTHGGPQIQVPSENPDRAAADDPEHAAVEARVKEESVPHEMCIHRSMTELDHDTGPGQPPATAPSEDIIDDFLQSSSVLGQDDDQASPRGRSGTFNPASKRVHEDESVGSNRSTTSKTPKKQKFCADSSMTARVHSFIKRIDSFAANGSLHASDLKCTKCSQDVKKDARVTSCLHLYDNKCLKELRAGVTGKGANKVACYHTGCGKEIGKPNVVTVEAIEELKQKHAADLGGYDTDDNTVDDDDDT